MSDAQWTLDVTPSVAETYEAMILAGRAGLRPAQHALVVVQGVLVGLFAPVGAAMFFWIMVAVVTGRDFADLPAAAIPITVLLFGALCVWIMRQHHLWIARMASRSRFGRSYALTLDATGVTLRTDHSTWHSGWADVALVRGGKTTLCIGISAIAIAVPLRCFLGPADAEDALATVQRWQQEAA